MFYILAQKAIGDIGDLKKLYAHLRWASFSNQLKKLFQIDA